MTTALLILCVVWLVGLTAWLVWERRARVVPAPVVAAVPSRPLPLAVETTVTTTTTTTAPQVRMVTPLATAGPLGVVVSGRDRLRARLAARQHRQKERG